MRDEAPEGDVSDAEWRYHTRRLAISWSAVANRLLTLHADELTAAFGSGFWEMKGDPALSVDPAALLPVLRTLPDGAGDEALIRALEGF
jgi:hypothetical protein